MLFSKTSKTILFDLSEFGFIFLSSDTENVLVSSDIPKGIFDFQTQKQVI